jgi:hypothetical protein
MKTFYQSLLLVIGALALAGTAFAQVPNSNDTSTTDGNNNTGMGSGALGGPNRVNLTGSDNTASGFQALNNNTSGSHNTASGTDALFFNTTGSHNTASGADALASNTDSSDNTASGFQALFSNTTGNGNTASGSEALFSNTTGSFNTATGYQALYASQADYDTAFGYLALFQNTTGTQNVASGAGALYANTSGSFNAALGQNALEHNTTASNNTATGYSALSSNTTGSNNIAEGYQAGYNLTTGSNDIDIGNVGVAGEDNTIRIGTKGTHKVTVIAGIDSSKVTGSAVYVTTTGRLGVLASSERFKVAISPMESKSAKLGQLRPVTFHLKSEPKGALQYGLIAEEVAKVYLELVIRNELGRIDGVRYDELAPMLLNEMQKKNAAQDAEIHDLKKLVAEMQVGLLKLQSKDELVAKR